MKISVVLPVYNESLCISQTLAAVVEYVHRHPNYEFLFVDDGSRDNSALLLEEGIARAGFSQIRLLRSPVNRGKGHAVKTGISQARGQYVCYLDSDLAYSLDHLDLLTEKLADFDLVMGCRNLVPASLHQPRPLRRLSGQIYNLMSRLILGLPYRDMQAGLKGFRADVAQDLFGCQLLSGFSFDVELIYLAWRRGYRIGEIPAHISPTHRFKASQVDLVKDSWQMFLDLFRIRFKTKHKKRAFVL